MQLLIEYLNDWTLNIKNKHATDVIYIDFAKAFDCVCHSKLQIKLKAHGICGNLIGWIAAFLHHRSQAVMINGVCSDYMFTC